MTLKSKKVFENKSNNRKNIRTKQKGGGKYTVIGHDKSQDPNRIKSDLYSDGNTDKYVFTENDIKIINNFFSNIKGANSEHYEFSNPDAPTVTDTKFNVFVDKLQKIMSNSTGAPDKSLLVATGSSAIPNASTGKKNVEINTNFLREILKKVSSNQNDLDLKQNLSSATDTTLKRTSRTDTAINATPLLGQKDTATSADDTKLPSVTKDGDVKENVGLLLDDLKEVYKQYHNKYKSQGENEMFGSFYQRNDDSKPSKLTESKKKAFYQDLKDTKDENRFKSLNSGLKTDGEKYFFSNPNSPDSYLKHKFADFTSQGLSAYANKKKSQNVTAKMSLGEGQLNQSAVTGAVSYEGKLGFEIADIDGEEIRNRYEWCYLMERIYLFKHMELLQLVINISYIINSLFIIYFLFTRIIRVRDVSDKPCPTPRQVVLPPTYRKIIQNYFNTQRGDLITINNQIRNTVVGIQEVLNSSMGITERDGTVKNGIPKEYQDLAVGSDFLSKPLSFATYNHLIKSEKLHIPVIYLFPGNGAPALPTTIADIKAFTNDLKNSYPNNIPDAKEKLVLSVSFDEFVYRSRKVKDASGIIYEDKYRYRFEPSAPAPANEYKEATPKKFIKIVIGRASSYDDIVEFFEKLKTNPSIAANNYKLDDASVKDLHELSFIKYRSSKDDLLDISKSKNYDIDDGAVIKKFDASSAYLRKQGKPVVVTESATSSTNIKITGNYQFADTEKFKQNGLLSVVADTRSTITNLVTKTAINANTGDIIMGEGKIDGALPLTKFGANFQLKTGDVYKTASIIVNLKKIPNEATAGAVQGLVNRLLEVMANGASKPFVIYFNVYKNQLKIVLGFPESMINDPNSNPDSDIDGSLAKLSDSVAKSTIFTGEFELQDPTRSIIFTSLNQTGGATRPIDDLKTSPEFTTRVKEVYGKQTIPIGTPGSELREYEYGYKSGSTYKIPYSISKEQIDDFKALEPYNLASDVDEVYKKFKFSSKESIQKYINQYKNIKELVIDSDANNSQLKDMIEFLNDDTKKSLHEFKQQVLKKELKITKIEENSVTATKTDIETDKEHGLKVGDMVNIKADANTSGNTSTKKYLFDDVAYVVESVDAAGKKFTIDVDISLNKFNPKTSGDIGTITAYVDQYDLNNLSVLQSSVDGHDTELYSSEHIQLYLNRCYELEKLYIIKHHEFLYMKNMFDKSFIFYLMTFIVFFYYVKTLGRVEKTRCKDSVIRVPKTFLGDIDLMVKNQSEIINNFNSPGPFKSIQELGFESGKPTFVLSGGAAKLSMEQLLKSESIINKLLVNFLNEEKKKGIDYTNLNDVLIEISTTGKYSSLKDNINTLISRRNQIQGNPSKANELLLLNNMEP